MKEIEVKVLEINPLQIGETLNTMGAKKVYDGDILTLFLDFQDNQIGKRKDVLRLRKENDGTELTYKKVKVEESAKIAEEYSVEVSDLQKTVEILRNLGLHVTKEMKKCRASYVIGEVRFDIDRYEDKFSFIPPFLEIEGPINDIRNYSKTLGFTEKDCLPWSTDELIAHYENKRT